MVLAAGEGAALARRSAAEAWGLVRESRRPRPTEVVCARVLPRLARLGVFREPTLLSIELTTWRGIAITTPMRTLYDLASVSDEYQLVYSLRQAEYHRSIDLHVLRRIMDRNRRDRRHTLLELAIRLYRDGSHGSGSPLEDRFLRLVRTAGMEPPLVNHVLDLDGEQLRPDCIWVRHRLVVEVDSGYHLQPNQRRIDENRDALLAAHGYRVLRVTGPDIDQHRGRHAIERLRAALAS